ncbi:MAG: hypothetical protein K2X00_07745 [Nitrospiraceae bacterium]|nr:hypothetical protein [Nitrospiraceae bacterium]OQW67360.1 MAG: hypothetical protein BVN29_03630 [Nitrospira sp. ST-bin5]
MLEKLSKALGPLLLFSLILFLAPGGTQAFGLKTHIWIGQQLLSEIRASCRVDIEGVPISINQDVCNSIRSHPDAFLSGVLGPDAYPDVITGQVTTHPGIKDDWQTNDWLVHMYSEAASGPNLAFAAGYLVHAASDVFAHTYVNSYAGDIFVLSEERRVELRHFLLEKYIDSRLPGYAFSPSTLSPPTEYLRDKLIHNSDASRLAKASGVALHITGMYDEYRNVADLARELDRIEGEAAKFIATLIVDITEFNLKLVTGEVQLKAAREVLSANELRLKFEQELFDKANRAFQDAATALQNNIDLINTLGHQAKLAKAAAEQAQRTGKDAIDQMASLQNKILDLEKSLAGIPAQITKEVCRDEVVGTVCGILCPFCGSVCRDSVNRVCRIVTEVNAAWEQVNGLLINARKDLVNAQARAAQAAVDVSTQLAIESAKLQEKASAETLTAGLEAAKKAVQLTYEIHEKRLGAEKQLTLDARNKVDAIAAEVERLRKQIVDAESIKQALQDLIANSDILSGLAKNWQNGMDIAGKEFILASDRISKGMLEGKANFVSTYLDWWRCYGQAYAAVPIQYGQAICAVENFMDKIDAEASKIIDRVLPPPFNKIYADYLNIRSRIKQEIKNAVNDVALHLAKLVSPDPTTAKFIELLARPDKASQSMMNNEFATAADSAKPLLVFDQVSTLIDSDIGLRNDKLDPEKFSAIRNAIALSKLSMMDIPAVKGLAWVLGADPEAIRPSASPGRASLLFDMVRSIDGNHQWQPFGLPYPSANGATPRPKDPLERRYGYGPSQERSGFQLFIDAKLRHSMFLRIFRGPMSPSLASQLSGYPFRECTNYPFAVAFMADGTGADHDDGCAVTASLAGRTGWEWWRRFVNRLWLNPEH